MRGLKFEATVKTAERALRRIAHAVRGLKSEARLLRLRSKSRIAHAVRGLKYSGGLSLSTLPGRIAHAVRGLKCIMGRCAC